MAGRPRTMLRRVARILERHEKLADELRELMPKRYLPGPGEGWDYPENLDEWGDDLMLAWRKAVFEIDSGNAYLADLVFLLGLKVEQVEQNATLGAEDTADELDDQDDDQSESPAENAAQQAPNAEDGRLNRSEPGGQDAAPIAPDADHDQCEPAEPAVEGIAESPVS